MADILLTNPHGENAVALSIDGIPYSVESRISPNFNSGFLLSPDIPSMLYQVGKLNGRRHERKTDIRIWAQTSQPLICNLILGVQSYIRV